MGRSQPSPATSANSSCCLHPRTLAIISVRRCVRVLSGDSRNRAPLGRPDSCALSKHRTDGKIRAAKHNTVAQSFNRINSRIQRKKDKTTLAVDHPNQVCCTDISYIPTRRGFLYLFAVLDWSTGRVLTWRLSDSLTTDFCVDVVEAAIATNTRPEIFNSDLGRQFTDKVFAGMLKEHGNAISMDGAHGATTCLSSASGGH